MSRLSTAPVKTGSSALQKTSGRTRIRWNFRRTWPFHVMVLPAVILAILFSYLPMAGIVMAFQEFKPWLGFFHSPWVGFQQFHYMFSRPDSIQVIWNTFIIAALKITANLLVPFVFALLLNEVNKMAFKRTVQTMVYLPHFLSWVVLGGILIDILSTNGGLVNQVLGVFGIEPIFFLGSNHWFRFTVVVTDVWKEFGFNTIIFLAALAGINPSLYEAGVIDGANRWKLIRYITIPSMIPITIVVGTLALGNILNAGFDQIFNLYNPLVYSSGDIIDTFVYRTAIISGKMSFGTAVGLFKSLVSFVMVVLAYKAASKFANYRIF